MKKLSNIVVSKDEPRTLDLWILDEEIKVFKADGWKSLGSKIKEAPEDGKQYARKDGDWAEIVSKSDVSDAINLIPNKFGYTGKVDVKGLKEIGWSDADIVYFKQYGVNWNDTEAENEANKVPQSDKDLMPVPAGQAGIDKIKTARATMKYCPMFDTSEVTDMMNYFADFKLLKGIPYLDTKRVTDMTQMFKSCGSLIAAPKLDFSMVDSTKLMFYNCSILKIVPDLNLAHVENVESMFGADYDLQEIIIKWKNYRMKVKNLFRNTKIHFIEDFDTWESEDLSSLFEASAIVKVPCLDGTKATTVSRIFWRCQRLKDFGGISGLKVPLSLSDSPRLTHQSLMNVIYEAANVTASPQTLTLGAINLAKLTEADKKIATDKGWTLA